MALPILTRSMTLSLVARKTPSGNNSLSGQQSPRQSTLPPTRNGERLSPWFVLVAYAAPAKCSPSSGWIFFGAKIASGLAAEKRNDTARANDWCRYFPSFANGWPRPWTLPPMGPSSL